jgi:uncharacterized OB-fold protein
MNSDITTADFPLPEINDWNRPFFESGFENKLKLQKCQMCSEIIYYPRSACPVCLSTEYKWIELSGRGKVYSYSIVWKPGHPAFDSFTPIILAAIELEEGPMMISNVINCAVDAIHINMPVVATYVQINSTISLPKFQPMQGE